MCSLWEVLVRVVHSQLVEGGVCGWLWSLRDEVKELLVPLSIYQGLRSQMSW